MIRVATDIGGTFTDLVFARKDGSVGIAKSHTTPKQFEQGVMDVINAGKISPSEFVSFVHGTTIVINAITEKKGVKTALITSKGFRDALEIGRGNRPDYFNLEYAKPEPFVERFLRREIPGRINAGGQEIRPLDLSVLPGILDDFRAEGVEAIAVCLINSYASADHETALIKRIGELWPEVSAVASYQISREWREYERTNTAVLSACVQPIAHRYLDRLIGRLKSGGMECTPYIMQSNCGIDTVSNARQIPITMVESGPASGVWGAAVLGRMIDETNVIALDIGGTTAKCSLISDGQVKLNTNYMLEKTDTFAGYPVMVPVVDLVEIGQGGGSIAWIDEFNRLHVGPRSAGAEPGPAAYGIGGSEATTTDANLALKRINPDYFCGGTMTADMDSVYAALDKLSARLNLSREDCARGIVRLANNSMVNAIKLISVNRGHDPRDFTLIAFGGGGGMHACALARELGIKKVVIPNMSGVFSAWGMLLSDLRRDYLRTQVIELDRQEAPQQLGGIFAGMEKQASSEYEAEGIETSRISFERCGRLRYQNQEHSTEINLPGGVYDNGTLKNIIENFHTQYEKEYTYRLDAPVEFVTFHLIARAEVDKITPRKLPSESSSPQTASKGTRQVDYLSEGILKAEIYDGKLLKPGMSFDGPAVIEEAEATIVIPPGMRCSQDSYGNTQIST